MSHNITVEGGTTVLLPTSGKYCDRDIVITATGTGGTVEIALQDKTVTPTKSTQTVTADTGYDGLESVVVNPIPSNYIVPSGTKDITQNGTHDVTAYKTAEVKVPIPDGYIVPSGEIEITENGTHDVTQYESVNVNVAGGGASGDSDLPAGYRRVDYIQFNDAQIVDTNIICTQNTRVSTYFTREVSSQQYLYGVASSGNTASVTAYLGGSWRFGSKSASKSLGTINANVGYGAYVSSSQISITGSVSTISGVNDFETVGTLLIGTCRSADGAVGDPQFVGKIFFFSIYNGDEQVRHLVPVTDGSMYRFWDSVSKTFFDSITDVPLEGGNV